MPLKNLIVMRLVVMGWIIGGLGLATDYVVMPLNCSELLPDNSVFTGFFEAVGRGQAEDNKALAKRVFRILALRDRLERKNYKGSEANPVDLIIRKTLCYYREQKEPIKAVPYDDEPFLEFLKSSLKEMESKVDDAVYQWEFVRAQRKEFLKRLERNQRAVNTLKNDARREADSSYQKLSEAADKKVRSN